MPCVTSSFNPGLLRRNLLRFWPLALTPLAYWILVLPVRLASAIVSSATAEKARAAIQEQIYLSSTTWCLIFSGVMGIAVAMAVFSYLCSGKTVGMLHSFPITRRGLFFTNYVSGLLMLLTAPLAALLVSAIVLQSGGWLDRTTLGWLLQWLLCSAGLAFLFYSMGVFSMMFTGVLLAAPVFYAVFNLLVGGLASAVGRLAGSLLYGIDDLQCTWLQWFSPASLLYYRLQVDYSWEDIPGGESVERCALGGSDAVAYYLALAAVLTVLSYFLYCRRRSESTGDLIAVNWARPVFVYGVGVCAALVLGQGLYGMAVKPFLRMYQISVPGMAACMALTGLLGVLAAEMLMKKSFRIRRGVYIGGAVLAALAAALVIAIALDAGGMEDQLPQQGEVRSVEVDFYGMDNPSYIYGTFTDPETVEQLRALHETLLTEKAEQKALAQEWTEDGERCRASLSLTYTLSDGSKLRRGYMIFPSEENEALQQQVEALYNRKNVVLERITGHTPQAGEQIAGSHLQVYYDENWNGEGFELSAEESLALYEALRQDVQNGCFTADPFLSGYGDGGYPAAELNFRLSGASAEDTREMIVTLQDPDDAPRLTEALTELGTRYGFVLRLRVNEAFAEEQAVEG